MWISFPFRLKQLSIFLSSISLYFVCLVVHAESGRTDYDIDNDGLIEINDLEDLNAIRQSLNGATLYGQNTGCKTYGGAGICNGFELTRDLDFDTNSDGIINNQDPYWNGGFGWNPIGQQWQPFKAIFDGNGYVIRNLVVNRGGYGGLFAHIEKATIRSVGFSGKLASIKGSSNIPIGSLATIAKDSWVSEIFSTVNLYATEDGAGGIIGRAINTDIRDSFVTGYVFGANYAGGIVGYSKDSRISTSFATGLVVGNDSSGGLIGIEDNESRSHFSSYASYWAVSETNQTTQYGRLDTQGLPQPVKEGAKTILELKCPQSKYDDQCGVGSIYSQWSTSGGFGHWDFGNSSQLPGLVFPTGARRDSDGDGSLDEDDRWPNNYAASYDSDLDGYPDQWTAGCDTECRASSGLIYDSFPLDKRFYLDADLDGSPDSVNQVFCDATCQGSLEIALDEFLSDRDNDGIIDSIDEDDNNDGIKDIDRDSDGLIDIETVEQLDAIRKSLEGKGVRLNNSKLNVSGCPVTYDLGKRVIQCHGYELLNDMNLDTDSNGVFDENDTFWNNGAGWTPIGKDAKRFSDINYERTESGNVTTRFQAVFEGNGFEIKNVVINQPDYDNIGFFGYVFNAEIRNVNFSGDLTIISGDKNVGGIVGNLHNSEIFNVRHVGQVTGGEHTGGIAGVASSSQIKRVLGSSTIKGDSKTGGILGYANLESTIAETHFDGLIDAGSITGGLAGYVNNDSQIDQSFVTGSIISSGQTTGGLVGVLRTSSISKSFVTGKIANDSLYTGGIVGRAIYHSTISNCFATGELDGSSYTGGLAGYISDTDIKNCFVAGEVNTSSSSQGGLVGYKESGTFENSYWATERTSAYQDYHRGSTYFGPNESYGHTLAEMQCVQSPNDHTCSDNILFKNWNSGLSNPIWNFGTNQQLPGLILNNVVYQDSDSDGILDEADQYPLDTDNDDRNNSIDRYPFISLRDLSDTDGDGIPNDCDTDCQALGMLTDTDDDNDGVLDINDAYPLISFGDLADTDGDGIPNDCETDCKALGMAADIDDDNDGVLDINDAYPLISFGDLVDTDGDGIPNVCETDCKALGMAADIDDDNDGVLDINDAYPLISFGDLSDTDGDGIPNDCDKDCQALGMTADIDDDNDGVLDINDAYPLISFGDLADTDGDGIPNDCETDCQALGMAADIDDDNDGVLDINDAYPLISLGDRSDTDGDGIPNDCDTACQALGMAADIDDDNDGVLNADDAYPLIAIGELLDTDNDGAPNTCDSSCEALGMFADTDNDNDGVLDINDAFPLDSTEQSDFDNDGLGDVADLDDDNDGVNDIEDPNLGADNGAPEIVFGPVIPPVAVTTEKGDAFELLVDADFLSHFQTVDVVDTDFTYEASLNGKILAIDENDMMIIPAGRQSIQLVAIDTSGNRSESYVLVLDVYPRVRFEQSTSIIGEHSTTIIKMQLTGDSPEYPVVVNFAINELSDVNQNDLDASFDIEAQHQVIIETGAEETLNRNGYIMIPIIEDNESENDELLIVDLLSAQLASKGEVESLFVIEEESQQHELTVTYQNLAPSVQLKLEQNGVEVDDITQGEGDVTITAFIQDGNGKDTHTLTWGLNDLGLNTPLGEVLSFNPDNISAGSYTISVKVIDSGVGNLTDSTAIEFEVVEPIVAPENREGASSGDGGGSITPWFVLLIILGVLGRASNRSKVMKR